MLPGAAATYSDRPRPDRPRALLIQLYGPGAEFPMGPRMSGFTGS